MYKIIVFACVLAVASAKTYFQEEFKAGWQDKWVQSDWKSDEGTRGDFTWTAGKFYNDAEADKGIQTSQDARFYATSAKFDKFSNKGKDLVLQYIVKHEQNIDCGGGYVKVFPSSLNQKSLNGDSEYNIMFGPDVCGSSTKRVHVILTYKGKNHLIKKTIPCETDVYSHLYTLVLHSDNTYEVQIDEKEVAKGSLFEDWDFLEPKEIKDPQSSKPSDWVDAKTIADPEDVKPEGYDDIVAQIPDADATKPDDWDDELDGEWEAPLISNPEYKGEWRAKHIPNPAYKGEWVHPMVANPSYVEDNQVYLFEDNAAVGFELWQVKAGTIFDDIILTDSIEEAKTLAAQWKTRSEGEKADKAAKDQAEVPAQDNTDDAHDDEDEDEDHNKDEL